MKFGKRVVNKEDIKFSLELMGIEKGDVVLVHSSLSSIGFVEGGTDAIIDAFLEAVGNEGTLAMSTLTDWFRPFNPETEPSAVGKISEEFRKKSGTLRSKHPVHSIAASGKYAEYITSGHENCQTGCGEGTPYLKIRDLNGKVILLGVDMDRNTLMHSLEEEIDALYLRTLDIPAPTYVEGYENKTFTLKKFPSGHRDFLAMTPELRKRDALIEGKIGDAVVKVINVKDLFSIGLELLQKEPLLFICHNEKCNSCHWSRLLNKGTEINYLHYKGTGCTDTKCEICAVE